MSGIVTRRALIPVFLAAWGWLAPVFADTPLTTELVTAGAFRPVFVSAPPDDLGRLFIIQKNGYIRVLDLGSGVLRAIPFLNIDSQVGGGTLVQEEQGLLGLAFHPNYAENGYFFVNYTDNDGDTVVARFSVTADPNIADANSQHLLLRIVQPQANHNGGWMDFGEDGYLYIATGDGGGADDDWVGHTAGVGNGQDITNNLLGKILRIDVDRDDYPGDATRNYGIPPTNPFVGVEGDDEIWAYGLRNPWRASMDRVTGDLYIADVGQDLWEEVNFQPGHDVGGANYGWRCREGAHDFNTSGDCSRTPFTEPIYEYSSGGFQQCSIIGGYVYRGCAIPDWRGAYFFGDWCSGQVWTLRVLDGVATDVREPLGNLSLQYDLVTFGQDAAGELYIVDQSNGRIYRIVADGTADPPTPHDYENDGDVDLIDVAYLQRCTAGLDVIPADCLCDVFDSDSDEDVDLVDFAAFRQALSGP